MTDSLQQIIARIDGITSVDDEIQLEVLQCAIEEYFASRDAAQHLDVFFRLFERFPESDGFEAFWSVLHSIEGQPGYESFVVASIQRHPSRFPVLMVNRMLNAGQSHLDGVNLYSLLISVSESVDCPPSVRRDAQRFVERHRLQT